MALKSSLLWFRRNWRNTSSRFFTSCGPWTIRADCCGGNKSQSLSVWGCAPPVLTQPHRALVLRAVLPECSRRPTEP